MGKKKLKPITVKWILGITILAIALVAMGQTLLKDQSEASTFKDLPPSHWAYDTVMWAIDLGITTGYPDGTFQPQKPVTEA